MAFQQLSPATLNATIYQAAAAAYASTVVNSLAGTAENLSAWVSLVATLTPLNPGPNTAAVTFGTVTASAAGVVTLQTADTDLIDVQPGSANLVITGKPTSGDIVQILCTGIVTLVATS